MAEFYFPVVTAQTAHSLGKIMEAGGEPTVRNWFEEMRKENPALAIHILAWAKAAGGDPFKMLVGPIFVYQLLKAQVKADTSRLN